MPVTVPVYKTGKNKITVTGTFNGEDAPVINCEVKAMGEPETVRADG